MDGKTILFVVLILILQTMALKLDIVSPAPFKSARRTDEFSTEMGSVCQKI